MHFKAKSADLGAHGGFLTALPKTAVMACRSLTGLYVSPVKSRYFKALQRFWRKRWSIESGTGHGQISADSRLSVGQSPEMALMCKAEKKTAIAGHFLITNNGLHAARARVNLQLLEYLKHQPGNQSRST